MLCTIEETRSNPISVDPSCATFRNDIVNWGKICHNIYLWDYTVDFAHQVMPFPNQKVLQENIRFFVRNNALQHFQQSNTSPGHEFSELKSYLLARLLWNPEVDVHVITKGFLRGYYGEAAPHLGRYISVLEGNLDGAKERLYIFNRPVAYKDGFLSAPAMAEYGKLFDQAEQAVSAEPDLIQRVKTARLQIQYAELAIAADDMFGPRGMFSDTRHPHVRPEIQRALDEFETVSAANHVRSVNESNLKPADFCGAIRGMLKLETDGNLAYGKAVTAGPPPSPKYGHGDIGLLTNGVHGSNDFGVQWLGWEGVDFDVTVDLGGLVSSSKAELRSLSEQRSWILHPKSISCSVSADGVHFTDAGTLSVTDDPRTTSLFHDFTFTWPKAEVRFVKLHVEGVKVLPAWHAGFGGKAWVFLDEVVVR
jgi:hypothetical protein